MERVVTGIVRTSFGVRGFMKVKSVSGETDHFLNLKEVFLSNGDTSRSFTVEAVEKHDNDLIMKLAGLDTPEDVRKYAGWEIKVDREKGARLSGGDYFISDLCSCSVVKDGKVLGTIKSVCEGNQAELLEIEIPGGKCFFVPFMDMYVGSVDLVRHEVELRADWLLE